MAREPRVLPRAEGPYNSGLVSLASVLRVQRIDDDRFVASSPPSSHRTDIFGGQVAAQALAAAAETVESLHRPNSVHCYFLRRGRHELPLEIGVQRIRAGRTYTSRRIEIVQDGKVIFEMLASFHAEEPGPEHENRIPDDVPDPDALELDEHGLWEGFVEMKTVPTEPPRLRWWTRTLDSFGGGTDQDYCALLYASDMRAAGAAMAAVGVYGEGPPTSVGRPRVQGQFGSLDHALWFHRPPDLGDWFFCEVDPFTVGDSRGLVVGKLFDRGGAHIATLAQEFFMKLGGEPPGSVRE